MFKISSIRYDATQFVGFDFQSVKVCICHHCQGGGAFMGHGEADLRFRSVLSI